MSNADWRPLQTYDIHRGREDRDLLIVQINRANLRLRKEAYEELR